MRIKNAFKVLMSNLNLIYKAMAYRVVCTAAIVFIAWLAVIPRLSPIIQSHELIALKDAVTGIFKSIFSGNAVDTETLPLAFSEFAEMLSDNFANVVDVIIGAYALLFVLRILFYAGDYAFGVLFDSYMSALTKLCFIPVFLDNFGKAMLYALIRLAFSLLIEAIGITIAVVIAVYGLRFISVFAVLISIFILVFTYGTEKSLLSMFMPNMISGKMKIGKAFRKSFPPNKQFGALLGAYAFSVMFLFYLNVSVGVFTFFTGLIVSLPFTSLFFVAICFIDWYFVNSRKYYIDYDNVVLPNEKRHGDANLLNCL